MGAKKLRFAAQIERKLRELFAVEEKANGDITVIKRGEKYHFNSEANAVPQRLITHRMSIHRSQQSVIGGTTIIHTVEKEDGTRERGASFIKRHKNQLIWPLYSTLFPDMTDDHYNISSGRTKRIIEIGRHNPKYSCLIYHVFVASNKVIMPDIHFAQLKTERFRYFQLATYVTYYNFPTTTFGFNAAMFTSERTIDKVQVESESGFRSIFPNGALPMQSSEVWHVVWTLSNKLNLRLAEILISDEEAPEEFKRAVRSHRVMFTRYPLAQGQITDQRPTPFFDWQPPFQMD